LPNIKARHAVTNEKARSDCLDQKSDAEAAQAECPLAKTRHKDLLMCTSLYCYATVETTLNFCNNCRF
jgi:hypothetical protein